MPVVINLTGGTVTATVLDTDFLNVQELLRSGLRATDVAGRYDRFRVQRYQGGRLIEQSVGSQPYLTRSTGDVTVSAAAIEQRTNLDISHRTGSTSIPISDQAQDLRGGAYAMELLGRPGPSFIHTWQELGYAEPVGAVNWPPSYWPVSRYPKGFCYSRWLTVPDAATGVTPAFPCVARVTATARVSANYARILGFGIAADHNWLNYRSFHFGRYALIVDTNPVLYTDEFSNNNPNILDSSGTKADYCSWKILKWRTFPHPQRAEVTLEAEVALKANRRYNFSFKYSDALTHGWVDTTAGLPGTWRDEVWESSEVLHAASTNRARFDPTWHALLVNKLNGGAPVTDAPPFQPSWVNLWESSGLGVQLDYGRSIAYSSDSGGADLQSRP